MNLNKLKTAILMAITCCVLSNSVMATVTVVATGLIGSNTTKVVVSGSFTYIGDQGEVMFQEGGTGVLWTAEGQDANNNFQSFFGPTLSSPIDVVPSSGEVRVGSEVITSTAFGGFFGAGTFAPPLDNTRFGFRTSSDRLLEVDDVVVFDEVVIELPFDISRFGSTGSIASAGDSVDFSVSSHTGGYTTPLNFSVQAVPEPSSIFLLSFGSLIFAFKRRR